MRHPSLQNGAGEDSGCCRIAAGKLCRCGMTLVELLVVLAIILMLAAATIPRLRPEIDRSRVRESARAIQLYFSSARNLAIANGRPCGVMIERLPAEPGCSMTLTQVESPAAYCGEAIPSLATVTVANASQSGVTVNISYAPGINGNLVKAGDLIQFGMQGPLYTVTANGGTSAYLDLSQGLAVPWGNNSSPVPYRIFRQPVKSVAGPLQLPSPVCIDLTFSGPDTAASGDPTVFWDGAGGDKSPILIMFAADGSVDQVYVKNVATRPVNSLCMLIGKRENVNDPDPQKFNMQDYNNLWVAINSRTGLIVTTDLAAIGDKSAVFQSRAYARQSDAMGGK